MFLINRGEIEGRLDANTYHPERTAIIHKLQSTKWELKPLKVVASFNKSLVSENHKNLPYIGLENVESNTGFYVETIEKESFGTAVEFKKGHILFPKLRPYLNKVYLCEFDGLCSTEFHILDSKQIDNSYLAHFLRSNLVVNQTKHLMSGNTLPRLQTIDIENLLIPILPIEAQAKIVSIFENACIKKRQKETEAAALLSSIDGYLLDALGITLPPPAEKKTCFYTRSGKVSGGRFDPFYHQMEFEELEQALINGKFKLKKLSTFLNQINYGASVKNEYADVGIPFLRISDLKRNEINVKEMMYLPETMRSNLGNAFVYENDFLISRSGTLGVVALVTKKIDGFAYGSFMIKFNLNQNAPINKLYLSYFLNSEAMQKIIAKNKIGAIQGNITIPTIKNLHIPLPPLEKQTEIAHHIHQIRAQAKRLQQQAAAELEHAKQQVERMILGEQ